MLEVDKFASNRFNFILLIRHPILLEKRHGLFLAWTMAVVESVSIKTFWGKTTISN